MLDGAKHQTALGFIIAKLFGGLVLPAKKTQKIKLKNSLYFIGFRPHNICAKLTAQNAQKHYVVRFWQRLYRIMVLSNRK